MNLIWALIAVIGMGTYAVLTSWLVIEKRKNRDLERDRRARARLRLEDKPYVLPKQNALSEIWGKWPGDEPIGDILEALNQEQVIQEPKELEVVPRCDYRCHGWRR